MMDAEKRTTTIMHNKYDDEGNLVGQFAHTVTTNETDDKIFLTHDWCKARHKDAGTGKSTGSWENKTGKQAYYESGDKAVPITGYTMVHEGVTSTFTFATPAGGTFKVEFTN